MAAGDVSPVATARQVEEREAAPRAEVLLVVAAMAAAVVGQGGYYQRESEVCGVLLTLAAVAVLAHRQRSRLRVGTGAKWTLAGMGALAGCTVLAGALDGRVDGAVAPVALIAGLAVIVVVVSASSVTSRRQLADIVLGLGVFLAATAWVGVAFHLQPLGRPDGGLWRAATTVTYENAAAALLAPLSLWGMARSTVRPGVAARLTVVALVAGLAATLSRAGLGSFLVGCVVLVALLGSRNVWRGAGVALIGALAVVVGLVPGMAAPGPARPAWAVLGLAAGLGIGVAGPGRPWRAPRWWRRADEQGRLRLGGRGLLALLVLLAFAAGLAVMAVTGLAGRSRSWSDRLSLSSPDRASAAAAAFRVWQAHLLSGVGPGGAVFIWTNAEHQPVFDRYAHDEYLQIAAEEGLIGLAGLGLLVAGVAATARQGWRSGRGSLDGRKPEGDPQQALRAGAIAGLACLAVHSGFDFLWHIPAVPMLAAVAIGLIAPGPGAAGLSPSPTTEEVP
jgi:O-Antigen ligase